MLVREYNPRGCEQRGVAKGVQEESDSSFTARSRRRHKYRLVLCDFEMPLRTAFFKSTLSVGHTGSGKSFLWLDGSATLEEERDLTLLLGGVLFLTK